MPPGEASKKSWAERVPEGYVSLRKAARILGRMDSVVRKRAIELDCIKMQGKGQPALIRIADLEVLKEMLASVRKIKKVKDPESKKQPEPPRWVEPILVPAKPDPQTELEQTVRKLIHLCEKLDIESLTIQDGKAEIVRTVTVTKQETINK